MSNFPSVNDLLRKSGAAADSDEQANDAANRTLVKFAQKIEFEVI